MKLPLVVIGVGNDYKRLRKIAGKTVTFISHYLTEDELRDYYRNSRAFLFAGEEDFGIVAAEAASAGIPVICFEKSGMAEIVEDGKTGIFFHEQNPSSIMRAIQKERTSNFSKAYIQSHAQKFAEEIFIRKMQDAVEATVESYREQYGINDKESS